MFSMFLVLYYENNKTYFYTSDYIKECNVCQQFFCNIYLVIIFKYFGGAIPPSSTVIKGYPNGETFYLLYNKKTYWDNTLNSYEGISIITRKGLKNGY